MLKRAQAGHLEAGEEVSVARRRQVSVLRVEAGEAHLTVCRAGIVHN